MWQTFVQLHIYIYVGMSFIHSFISIQPYSPCWQEPEPCHVTSVSLAHYILGKLLGVFCHCFPPTITFINNEFITVSVCDMAVMFRRFACTYFQL